MKKENGQFNNYVTPEGKPGLFQPGLLHEFTQDSRFDITFAVIRNRKILGMLGMFEDSVAAFAPNFNPSSCGELLDEIFWGHAVMD